MVVALTAMTGGVQAASESRRTADRRGGREGQTRAWSASRARRRPNRTAGGRSPPEENQRPRVNGMGSGVLIDRRGYILTNHHVVDKVQGIVVQLFDGTTYPARLLQFDAVMDLAMLKVDAAASPGGDRIWHVLRPDGRRDRHHDRQRVRLREHGLGGDHQQPCIAT